MKQREEGFSLVEVLIALTLMAIIIPALTLGLQSLVNINNRARDLTLISIIAENKIESLRSIGYNSVAAGTFDFSSDLPLELGSPKSASYTVTQGTGLKTIDVTITYKDNKSSRTTLYKSIISETGVGQ